MAHFLLVNEAIEWEQNHEFQLYRRHLRDTTNPFEMPDEVFRRLYRFTKQGVFMLIDQLLPFLNDSDQPGAIAPHHQVLVALNVLGNGLYQRPAGQDFLACMSQTSVSIVLHRVVNGLNELMDQWISFPTNPAEIHQTKTKFLQKYQFPGIIGVIDGSHIAIVPPNRDREHNFINRKQYHSLNVMIVCDADMKITFVNAAHGGRTHDARVFLASLLSHHLQLEHEGGRQMTWLLGDSGYPLLPYLLTPKANQEEGTPGYEYTRLLCRIRSLVERVIGLLKGIFRLMRRDRTLHYTPEIADYSYHRLVIHLPSTECTIGFSDRKPTLMVNACCVLHNMRLSWGFPVDDEPIHHDEMDLEDLENALDELLEDDADGIAIREALINNFFANRMP